MRRALGSLFLSGLVLFSGCLIGRPPEGVVTPKTIDTGRVVPPITPESFTEANYREVAQALAEEMDREERESNAPSSNASLKRR